MSISASSHPNYYVKRLASGGKRVGYLAVNRVCLPETTAISVAYVHLSRRHRLRDGEVGRPLQARIISVHHVQPFFPGGIPFICLCIRSNKGPISAVSVPIRSRGAPHVEPSDAWALCPSHNNGFTQFGIRTLGGTTVALIHLRSAQRSIQQTSVRVRNSEGNRLR